MPAHRLHHFPKLANYSNGDLGQVLINNLSKDFPNRRLIAKIKQKNRIEKWRVVSQKTLSSWRAIFQPCFLLSTASL